MANPADTLIGTVIDGRFEIRDKLGQGGMGTVYRAWQRSVGREVAIKLIDRSISNDPMSVRRFLREAHLASQLSHPNTISVFDFGHLPDGRLFTAMELLRGRTLGRELREVGAFPLGRIVRIGTQMCDALEAAHGQRIVHRDLKLDNVMLLDHGNDLIKVLDFGLAKTLDDRSTRATAAGIVVGTPRYIAPETAMTGEATPASDMYAIGVMLGELALAAPLWEGTSLSEILQFQLQPGPIVRKVPRPVRDVVARLLDPKPHNRPNARDTRKLLEAIEDGEPLPAPAPERATLAINKSTRDRDAAEAALDVATTTERDRASPPSRRSALIAGGTIVFVGSVLIAYFAMRKRDQPARVGNPHVVASTPDATFAAVAPDPTIANDPWSSGDNAANDLSPIVKSPTDNHPDAVSASITITVLGIPKGFLLEANDRPVRANKFSMTAGDKLTLDVWNPDHTALFRERRLRPDHDAVIDVGVHALSDCNSSEVLCKQVYCGAHRSDPGCPKHDTDVVSPFE